MVLGRPYGGVALLWHKRIEGSISSVSTSSDRIVAVRVRSNYGSILVVAVYMPVDYGDFESCED